MLSKPSTAPAGGAVGAPAAPAFSGGFGAKGGGFSAQAGGVFGGQPTVPAQQTVDPAKAASEAAEKPRYFTTEHFVPASGYEKKPSAKTRINGPEVADLKQRPLVMEYVFEERAFLHYTVVLDRAKHTVPTYCQADVQKAWEVCPRPGPDNLFEMLAILAIELKVPVLFSSD